MHRGCLLILWCLGPAWCALWVGCLSEEEGSLAVPREPALAPFSLLFPAKMVALVTRPDYFSFCLFMGKGLRGISLLEKELHGWVSEDGKGTHRRFWDTKALFFSWWSQGPSLRAEAGSMDTPFVTSPCLLFPTSCAGGSSTWVRLLVWMCPLWCQFLVELLTEFSIVPASLFPVLICSVGSFSAAQPAPSILLILTSRNLKLLRKRVR